MSEFSKDELVPPTWLDKDFFHRAMRSFKRDASIKIKDVVLSPGTKPGEHYASVMFRANITYSTATEGDDVQFKVILKTMPVDGHKLEFLKNSPAFKCEAKMYSVILPEMERILRVAGDSTVFAPPLVYQNVLTEPSPVIVLQDISPDGFETFNDGINNMEQVKLIMQKVAKFHAVSIYLNENGFPLQEFDSHYWTDGLENDDSMMAKFIKPGLANLVESMKTWEGFEGFRKKLDGTFNYHSAATLKALKEHPGYRVLNHGDFHAKNMMFRNGGLKDEDLIFVDFQFSMFSTPSLDLAFTFSMLVDDRLTDVHRDDIIRIYYDEFKDTLKKINYAGHIPSMLELQIANLQAAPIDLLYTTFTIPPRLFNWREIDLDEMMENMEEASKEWAGKVHSLPEYHEFLRKNLKRLELTGVMDI